jgi:RNA polymerase sigma-70 factor (ECF subfamily)
MCRHDADAEDVLQEALLAIAQHLPQYEGRSSLSSWAFAVTRSACAHRRRGLKNQPAESLDSAVEIATNTDNPESDAARAEARASLERALAALDDDYREVLLLRDAEGLTHRRAGSIARAGHFTKR